MNALDKLIDGPGSRADKARALFDLGCERNEVVELLGMSYSQAHGIWAKRNKPGVRKLAGTRAVHLKNGHTRYLRLSPSQTRVITQDGHQIIRVDKDSGPVCQECSADLSYDLKWLGFVHTFSKAKPTHIEDHYEVS